MNRKCQVTGANLFMLLTDESPNTNDVICTVIFFMSLFIVMESPTKTCSRIIISFPGTFKQNIENLLIIILFAIV